MPLVDVLVGFFFDCMNKAWSISYIEQFMEYTNVHVIANQFIAWKNICRVRPIKKLFAASCRVCEIVSPVRYDQQNLGKFW
jgi:hypothetical protein